MNRTARILAVALAVVLIGVAIYVAYQNGFETGALTAAVAGGAEDGGATVVIDRGWSHRGGFGGDLVSSPSSGCSPCCSSSSSSRRSGAGGHGDRAAETGDLVMSTSKDDFGRCTTVPTKARVKIHPTVDNRPNAHSAGG